MIKKSKRSRKTQDERVLVLGKRGKLGAVILGEQSIGQLRRYTTIPLNPLKPPRVTNAVLDQILQVARVPEQHRSTVKPFIKQAVNAPFDEPLTKLPPPRISGRSARTPFRRIARALQKNADLIDSLDEDQYSLFSRGLEGMPLVITAGDRNSEVLDGKGYAILLRNLATAIDSGIVGPRRPAHRPLGSAQDRPLKTLIDVLRLCIEQLGHGNLSFSCDESGGNCKGPLVDVLEILQSSFPPGVIPSRGKLKRSMLRRPRSRSFLPTFYAFKNPSAS
jgi:hypothetical protein